LYATDDNSVRVSRTEYQYDQTPAAQLTDTPGVIQHVAAPDQRGNLTSVKRYADAVTLDSSTAVVETRTYDICGNVRTVSSSCCEQTSFNYPINPTTGTNDTYYAWPGNTVRGSATDTTQQITTSAVYDLNTGLVLQATDANGRMSYTTYQTTTLRPEYENAPTGAYNYHIYDDTNLIVYDLTYEQGQSGGNFASRSDKYIEGHGRVHGEIAYTVGYDLDIVVTKFDNLGRLWQQTRPYRYVDGNETKYWYTYKYDKQDRAVQVIAPDGSVAKRDYNQTVYDPDQDSYTPFAYPSAATPSNLAPGQTIRATDPWGRQRWARFDAQNRMVEVVEPDAAGDGTVANNGWLTKYSYSTLGNLTGVDQGQGGPTRSFNYDALGRLTQQKLAERDATLNDAGGAGTQWSDVFTYDTRSNLTSRTDARRVKTTFTYNNDPLNRLQSVSYDKSQSPQASSILDAAMVTYHYATSGDLTRVQSVDDGLGSESFGYDSEFRINQKTRTIPGRNSLVVSYGWDSLDRLMDLTYPTEYFQVPATSKVAHYSYDLASRLSGVTFDGSSYASAMVYNASSQTLSLNVGGATNQLSESYTYDAQTGLLTNQKVQRAGVTNPLLDLSYDYTLTTNGPKTGQLTKVTDNLYNLTHSSTPNKKNRTFEYDAVGRLKTAKGGPAGAQLWTQSYQYDRYGNRTSVTATGVAENGSLIPLDGLLGTITYNTASNRMTSAYFEYDAAGNQTRALQADGTTIHRYQYDAAGRLVYVQPDVGSGALASYSYGASNQRVKVDEGGTTTYYAWDGSSVIAEYQEPTGQNAMAWDKSYVYMGGRLLATRSRSSGYQYYHPDRLGTRLVTNASDLNVSEQVHLPFGTALDAESSGTMTKRRFTSYDRSGITKLDYAVNRHYNAGQGRFTQVDPMEMEAASLSDPQTLNLYAYCGNDPVNRVDPDGLFWKWLGKAFRFLFKVATAVLVALAVLAIPVWGATVIYLGLAALTGLAGWHNGRLGQIAGAFLSAGFGAGGYGGFRTPSTFPGGTSVSGVNNFLQQQRQQGQRRISELGLEIIRQFEAFRSRPYNDPSRARNCTIGYGHMIHRGLCTDEDRARYGNGISEDEAEELLRHDVAQFEQAVNRLVTVELNQNQFDALVSFTYNVGTPRFQRSTLLRLLNGGNYDAVPGQLRRFNRSGGRVLRGLIRRRRLEGALFSRR